MAISIRITDENKHAIFETSSEPLGNPLFTLEAGESYRGTFELKLNMAHGTFRIVVGVYRYDTHQEYDRRLPAMVFIGSTMAVRGTVNCFPRFLEAETAVPTCVGSTSDKP